MATGFNRHFPDESNSQNMAQRRQELLNDITDTVGSTFLGLTYGCARCHDHKFDPILQKDYYRLQAFFANTRSADEARLTTTEQHREYETQYAAWAEKTQAARDEMHQLVAPRLDKFYQSRLSRFPEDLQAIIKMPPPDRSPFQWQMYQKAKPQLYESDDEAARSLKGARRRVTTSLRRNWRSTTRSSRPRNPRLKR